MLSYLSCGNLCFEADLKLSYVKTFTIPLKRTPTGPFDLRKEMIS